MASEKVFEGNIKRYLKSKGCYYVKYFGCGMSTNGTPDILACINGHFVGIEVKAQKGKPSELQLAKIEHIRKAGGFGFVLYPSGWNKFKKFVDDLLKDEFSREEDIEIR